MLFLDAYIEEEILDEVSSARRATAKEAHLLLLRLTTRVSLRSKNE